MSSFLSCFYLKPKEHQVIVEEQSPQEIKEVENKEVVKEHEPVSTPQKKIEEDVPPLIVIDDNDCQVSTKRLKSSIISVCSHLHLCLRFLQLFCRIRMKQLQKLQNLKIMYHNCLLPSYNLVI